MLRATRCSYKIPSANIVSNRLYARIALIEAKTTKLLECTTTTSSLSLDGWTS